MYSRRITTLSFSPLHLPSPSTTVTSAIILFHQILLLFYLSHSGLPTRLHICRHSLALRTLCRYICRQSLASHLGFTFAVIHCHYTCRSDTLPLHLPLNSLAFTFAVSLCHYTCRQDTLPLHLPLNSGFTARLDICRHSLPLYLLFGQFAVGFAVKPPCGHLIAVFLPCHVYRGLQRTDVVVTLYLFAGTS